MLSTGSNYGLAADFDSLQTALTGSGSRARALPWQCGDSLEHPTLEGGAEAGQSSAGRGTATGHGSARDLEQDEAAWVKTHYSDWEGLREREQDHKLQREWEPGSAD